MFLTFDLDRVLIQNPFELGVFPAIRQRLRPYVHPNMTQGVHPDLWLTQRIVAQSDARTRAGDWVGAYDWDSIINGVAKELGYPKRLDVEELVRFYCRPGYIASYPDVAPMLDHLRSTVDSMWWISNGFARYQKPVVEALGLQQYFDGYFAPDLCGAVKPQAQLFGAAVHASGQSPGDGVHVGDRFTDDVAGSRRAGMYAVLIERDLPQSFRDISPLELPKLETFRQYAVYQARREGLVELHHLDVERDCIPDAVITSLDQLPQVLSGLVDRGEGAG